MIRIGHILIGLAALLAASCSHRQAFDSRLVEQPALGQVTKSARLLAALPPAKAPIAVSVYAFDDQTGQLKPNNNFAEYSRAVTQGGLAVLSKALLTAGGGNWFTVVERAGLRNLLQERQIVTMMREQYTLPDGKKLEPLPPLLYAGLLIEGGIVGYDSNIVTGGVGAKYMGIGADVKHQRDVVTIDLRAINVSTGQVMLSVTSEKTIYSTALTGSIFRYVAFDKLLEMETGVTMNEPPQLAVRQAIDTAVYSMVMEGIKRGLWEFNDPVAGQAAMNQYMALLGNQEVASASSTSTTEKTQLSQPSAPAPGAQLVPSEKKSIIDKISNMFDDEKSGNTPLDHPPVPLPARRNP